jgi:hypothetical protein
VNPEPALAGLAHRRPLARLALHHQVVLRRVTRHEHLAQVEQHRGQVRVFAPGNCVFSAAVPATCADSIDCTISSRRLAERFSNARK